MTSTSVWALCVAATSLGGSLSSKDIQHQNQFFRRYWGTDFVWKFDDLPAKGTVTQERVPYSGCMYLDNYGGTASALSKYDRAFHPGRMPATSYERWDTTAFQEPVARRGLFGWRGYRMATPGWHGHCNGWTAAAIRHAEPRQSVTRNGVVFSPADIKGLLAELYIYNDTEDLSASTGGMPAGLLHAVIANWLGRGLHPLGMEADPGPQKWNYPVYAFSTSSAKRSERQVEVKLTLGYAKETRGEYQQSPRIRGTKYFHYRLDLNADGEITGGTYYGDSSQIDMLWVPLQPKPPGKPGHERGNPHVDVQQVLAIWRDSVPADVRSRWLTIDPPAEDRIADVAGRESLVPVQHPAVADAETPAAQPPPTAPAPGTADEGPVDNPATVPSTTSSS